MTKYYDVAILIDGNNSTVLQVGVNTDVKPEQCAVRKALRRVVADWESGTYDYTTTIEVTRVTPVTEIIP